MRRWFRSRLEPFHAGRRIVVSGCVGGVGLFAGQIAAGDSVFSAFVKGAGVAFMVMVVAGTARTLWRGGEVEQASAPGGWGLKFFGTAKRTLRLMEDRISSQMTTINDRLYDLEKVVFKRQESDTDRKE